MTRRGSAAGASLVLAGLALGALLAFAPEALTVQQKEAAPTGPEDTDLLAAIEAEESGGDPFARNDAEDAVGVLQITPIMVRDVNRIVGWERFCLDDRWDVDDSRAMFWIYAGHYSPGADRETIARRWNGGPDGDTEPETLGYWERVKSRLR